VLETTDGSSGLGSDDVGVVERPEEVGRALDVEPHRATGHPLGGVRPSRERRVERFAALIDASTRPAGGARGGASSVEG
jgi:hypothetical protein